MTVVNLGNDPVKSDFEIAVRNALWRKRWSIQDLADHIRRPRPTVSACINRGRFARVRKQIAAALQIS